MKIKINYKKYCITILIIICGIYLLGYMMSPSKVNNTASTAEIQTVVKPSLVKSWDDFNSQSMPMIASLDQEDIYLYAIKSKDFGVVLDIKGRLNYFDWVYITPRFVLPRMNYMDYDGDGQSELVVVLYVGSGTGYAVEELHVLELTEGDAIDSILDIFTENIATRIIYNIDQGGYLLGISVDDKQFKNIDLQKYFSKDEQFVFSTRPAVGSIIKYEFQEDGIVIKIGLGIMNDRHATPVYVGDLLMDVKYTDGGYTLENPRLLLSED